MNLKKKNVIYILLFVIDIIIGIYYSFRSTQYTKSPKTLFIILYII